MGTSQKKTGLDVCKPVTHARDAHKEMLTSYFIYPISRGLFKGQKLEPGEAVAQGHSSDSARPDPCVNSFGSRTQTKCPRLGLEPGLA